VINAQRQILRPLSFRFHKLGDKRAETNSAPFLIPHTFSSPRLDRVQQNAETNYGHSASCINQEEKIRQYQDDVSVLIMFKFLQVPLAGRFTGQMMFRSNEISVLSLLPFYLQ